MKEVEKTYFPSTGGDLYFTQEIIEQLLGPYIYISQAYTPSQLKSLCVKLMVENIILRNILEENGISYKRREQDEKFIEPSSD